MWKEEHQRLLVAALHESRSELKHLVVAMLSAVRSEVPRLAATCDALVEQLV